MASGYMAAPEWAERVVRRTKLRHPSPALLLIHVPDQDCWVVATARETAAIADPHSDLGRLLRWHCALLSLPYASNN